MKMFKEGVAIPMNEPDHWTIFRYLGVMDDRIGSIEDLQAAMAIREERILAMLERIVDALPLLLSPQR